MQNHPCINGSIIHFMRIGLLSIVFASCMANAIYASPAMGQEVLSKKLSLVENREELKDILRDISRTANVKFIYVSPGIPDHMKVTVVANDDNLATVLDRLLRPYNIGYEVVGKQIILKPLTAPVSAFQGVKGRVADATGTPIAGASVTIKGKKGGTSTNEKGEFSIDVAEGTVLEITAVGFAKQTLTVGTNHDVSVIMPKSESTLNDIVVVGYGTSKKVNLTGAVATVSDKDLENRPVTNLTNALEGTMAGVTVVQTNGQPGQDGGVINIRGVGTLNNTNPMIVVDGNIVGSMNDVNPNDIASISVLKDAASAAIYGSRAANGVLLITTKKGKTNGKATISYDAYVGRQRATALPDYLPSWQAATLYNQALVNEGGTATYTAAQIDSFKLGTSPYNYPNTDWLGLFYSGSGLQQSHNLGVSGGNEKTQYYFSMGYFDQDGITPKTNTQRYSTRLNLNTKVNDWFSVYAKLSYTYQPTLQPQSSYPGVPAFSQMIRQVNRISPMIPYKYANGDYGYIADGSPMAWLNASSFDRPNKDNYQGIAGADIEPIKNLHIRPQLAYAVAEEDDQNFVASIQYYTPEGQPSFFQGPNNASETYQKWSYFTPQLLADYSYNLNNNHFKILGGYSQELDNWHELYGYRQNFLNNSLSVIDLGSPTGQVSTGDANELALRSVFGRLNYDFNERYLFEANLRYDGTSRFASGNQYGTFPSFSAGWRISEENFFKPLKDVVNNLKLRASWGKLGNQIVQDNSGNPLFYPAISTVSAGQNYVFGGQTPVIASGVAPTTGVDPTISWETTTETNFGLDADFIKNRLSLTADYFIKNTTGILYDIPVSGTYGLTPPVINAASMRNQGLELALSYHNNEGKLTYNVSGNAAFIKNEVTSLAGTGAAYPSNQTILQVGLPRYAFYGYVAQGLFKTQDQLTTHASQTGISPNTSLGDLMYKDVNKDGVINQSDKVYLGTNFPKVTFGLNVNLGYKHFDLTAFFQGTAGVKNFVQGITLGQNSNGAGKPTAALWNSYSATNTGSNWPRAWINYEQNDPADNPSSYWIRNAAYVRMKNLQLGYTLPDAWSKTIHVQRLRFYYSGQNLFTITQFYKWVDPESPSGTAGYDYPQVKVNSFGLNLTF